MQEPDLVAKALRSVLHSSQHGIPLSELQDEYRSLTGEWIPFRHLGYATLEAYVASIPEVVRIERNQTGEVRIWDNQENCSRLQMAFMFVKCENS